MKKTKITICENDQRWNDVTKQFEPCTEKATTTRKNWIFGDTGKGEPAIVDTVHPLCKHCAELWDESQEEAEWEARVS